MSRIASHFISVEEMSKELIKTVKYKPKQIATEVKDTGVEVSYYKPKSNTSAWTVVSRAAQEENKNNPYVKKFLLDRLDNDSYCVINYASNILKERWPELEQKLIEVWQSYLVNGKNQFCSIFRNVDDYIRRLKINDWPEMEELLLEQVTDEKVLTWAASLNNTDENQSEENFIVIELIIQILFLLSLGSLEKQKYLFNRVNMFVDKLYELKQIETCSTYVNNNFLGLDKFIYDLDELMHEGMHEAIAQYYTKMLKRLIERTDKEKNSGAAYNIDDAVIRPKMFICNYKEVLKKIDRKNLEEFFSLLSANAAQHPELVFPIAANLNFKFDDAVEEAALKAYCEALKKKLDECVENCRNESSWSYLYWSGNLCRAEGPEGVLNYIKYCIKNRTVHTDKFFMILGHEACFKKYVDILRDLVRSGYKLKPI